MKKYILHLIAGIILLTVFLALPQTHFAVTLDKDLIQDLHYNREEHLLTGRTAPSANVSFTEMVADVVADDQGNFTLPIPEDLKVTQIRVDDYIGDRYAVVDYDFERGAVAEAVQSTSSQAETMTTTTQEIMKSTETNQPTTLTTETSPAVVTEAPKTKKSYASLFWLVLGIIMIAALASGGFYYYKRKKNQAATAIEVEPKITTDPGQRKKRRRKKRKKN